MGALDRLKTNRQGQVLIPNNVTGGEYQEGLNIKQAITLGGMALGTFIAVVVFKDSAMATVSGWIGFVIILLVIYQFLIRYVVIGENYLAKQTILLKQAQDKVPADLWNIINIDDDGIIPLLPRDCPFSDNAIIRLENFIRLVFGEDHFKDNWNYITQTLGNTENYLLRPTGFWKDHKTMYQKTPIYWLFSSKKGTFKCLVYMHRMNQFTAREVRDKYLLKYIEFLRNMIKPLEAEEATLGREDKKKLKGYKEALADCEEYDLRLHEVAQKFIDFDLDDGVKKNYAKFGDILATI